MRDGRKCVAYTERDYAILNSLYKYRTLTTRQINRIFFGNRKNKSYIYTRMYYFRNQGLIETRPIVNQHGRKETSCYMLTDVGIKFLFEQGIIEHVQQAKDIQVEGYRLLNTIEINEIYAQLSEYGWEMIDSRKVKEIFQMDRTSLIQGLLINTDKERFAIYHVSENPRSATVNRMVNEIKKNKSIRDVLVFVKGPAGYERFLTALHEKQVTTASVRIFAYDVGIYLMKAIGTQKGLEYLYEQYGEVALSTITFPYLIKNNDKEMYIAELLTNNQMTKKSIYQYHTYAYQQDGKPLLVLCWPHQVEKYKQDFQEYPHITFIGVEKELLERCQEIARDRA